MLKETKTISKLFDDQNIAWINSLSCLKNCGMSILEMKEYLALCMQDESTIPERQKNIRN